MFPFSNREPLDLESQLHVPLTEASIFYKTPQRNTTFRLLNWIRHHFAQWDDTPEVNRKFKACPYTNCVISANRSLLAQADAVVVHMNSLGAQRLQLPVAVRKPAQLWIALNREAPTQGSTKSYRRYPDWFNATMSYQRASDIYFPYGYTYPVSKNHSGVDPSKINTARPRLAAWLVSHCETHNRREDYVRALQKHMKVDVYGRCGPLNCTRDSSACKRLLKSYKFYLSFENANCVDYITEKLWLTLRKDVVPVVMGGADYKRHLPPHSFIDVREFASAKHLADYLLMLSNNDALYRQYFEWKRRYRIGTYGHYCQMCAYMNRVYGQEHTGMTDEKMAYFADADQQCVKPENYFTREDLKTFA